MSQKRAGVKKNMEGIATLQNTLATLLKEHNMSESQLGKALSMPRATINRIASGKTPDPRVSTLNSIAKYFNITVNQLLGEQELSYSCKTQQKQQSIPLIEMEDLLHMETSQILKLCEDDLITGSDIPENCFAVKLTGEAMFPQFQDGSILIVNPSLEPKNRSMVIAKKQAENVVLFRQVIIDGHQKYLSPINTVFEIIPIEKEDSILGVVVQARRDL